MRRTRSALTSQKGDYFLRCRILERIRRFLRPILRRPFPVFFVPTIFSACGSSGQNERRRATDAGNRARRPRLGAAIGKRCGRPRKGRRADMKDARSPGSTMRIRRKEGTHRIRGRHVPPKRTTEALNIPIPRRAPQGDGETGLPIVCKLPILCFCLQGAEDRGARAVFTAIVETTRLPDGGTPRGDRPEHRSMPKRRK